ncbi:hypothetical protein [Pelotalea chapellei]|uniref:Import inner membrane translocase subunit Tim44 n=1 Tax=Pelotalea chapellei TaxID=44671 RepID=A0ABS5U9V2_9BACT|nr:hypothetical protein [Pelotalea chapellei]MBT1072457.1 hypothetical protein [Pelotalea chapellei]
MNLLRGFTIFAAVLFFSITVMEVTAHARAGGSRSFGSRGSRSYSAPARPSYQPSQPRQAAPSVGPFQQQAGGGFMRSMAGGMMGGMLGSMLFSGMAGAGAGVGGGMGSGFGLFEMLLLAGLGYLLFRFIKGRKPNQTR